MNAQELTVEVAKLTTQVVTLAATVDKLKEENTNLLRKVTDLERSHTVEVAVLKHDIEELKKSKDLWSNRLTNLVMLIIGAVLTYLVRR